MCPSSKILTPMLAEVSKNYKGIVPLVYLDIDDFPGLAEELEVEFVPTTLILHEGSI